MTSRQRSVTILRASAAELRNAWAFNVSFGFDSMIGLLELAGPNRTSPGRRSLTTDRRTAARRCALSDGYEVGLQRAPVGGLGHSTICWRDQVDPLTPAAVRYW